MKIQNVLAAISALVSCAIAVPFTIPIHNTLYDSNHNTELPAIILFLAGFIAMVFMGWVKRVHK